MKTEISRRCHASFWSRQVLEGEPLAKLGSRPAGCRSPDGWPEGVLRTTMATLRTCFINLLLES